MIVYYNTLMPKSKNPSLSVCFKIFQHFFSESINIYSIWTMALMRQITHTMNQTISFIFLHVCELKLPVKCFGRRPPRRRCWPCVTIQIECASSNLWGCYNNIPTNELDRRLYAWLAQKTQYWWCTIWIKGHFSIPLWPEIKKKS